MKIKKQQNFLFLLVFTLILFPLASAVTITDTTFFSTDSGSTVFIDSMELDVVTTTITQVELDGVISIGSQMFNTNLTTTAIILFTNLGDTITISNVNTSEDLFTSRFLNRNVMISFAPSVVLITKVLPQTTACNDMVNSFLTYPALIGLVGLILLLGAALLALTTGFVSLNSKGFSLDGTIKGLIIVISIAVLIIVAIFLLSSLCTLF